MGGCGIPVLGFISSLNAASLWADKPAEANLEHPTEWHLAISTEFGISFPLVIVPPLRASQTLRFVGRTSTEKRACATDSLSHGR
jgi:hypothetical protein